MVKYQRYSTNSMVNLLIDPNKNARAEARAFDVLYDVGNA
jgi:hypothetical protein